MRSYSYCVHPSVISYNSPFRNREDIISLLIHSIRLFTFVNFTEYRARERDYIDVVLKIDKMSRLFVSLNNQIHTAYFPFHVIEDSNRLKVEYHGIEVDARNLAAIERILSEIDLDSQPMEEMIDSVWTSFSDLGFISQLDQILCWNLFLHFMTFETGYLRYDCDTEHQNGRIHPLHHIDLNYSNGGKFKIGLDMAFSVNDMADLLDTNTECRYLQNLPGRCVVP